MRKLLPILALVVATQVKAQSAYTAGESLEAYLNELDPPNGSRFLFGAWPKGYVLGSYDTVLRNPNLFLNYDKINHNLYFTADGRTITRVATDQARELHFEGRRGHVLLVRVDGIDPRVFFQQLSDSAGESHYVLYRRLRTQFHRSVYDFDDGEYIDSYKYYLVMPGGREYAPIKLKRRSIRDALGSLADAWLATRGKNQMDEDDLTALVNRLNKNN